LSFIFGRRDEQRIAMIGAIQGRNLENIQEVYKDLTKKLHGCRPRDFLVVCLQLLCQAADVKRLLGVCEDCRHHRHQYFGAKTDSIQGGSYDDIWAEREGVQTANGFFEMPAFVSIRPQSDIATQKRPMYRRRYALYQRVRGEIMRLAGKPSEVPESVIAE